MYTESESPAKVRKMSPSPMEASTTISPSTSANTTDAHTSSSPGRAQDSAGDQTSIGDVAHNPNNGYHYTASEDHGSEAPPQPSPEVLPPVSAAHAPQSPLQSPKPHQHSYHQPQSPPRILPQSPGQSPISPNYPSSAPSSALRPTPAKCFSNAGGSVCPPDPPRSTGYSESYISTVDLTKQDDHQAGLEQQRQQLQHHVHQVQQSQQQQQQQQVQPYQASERVEAQPMSSHDRGHNSDSDSTSSAQGDSGRRYREVVPDDQKDMQYWEKRRRNNEAARKSREKRRIHDMVLEGRISSLENANTRLRRELLSLKQRYNVPDSSQVAVPEEEDLRETGYKSDSLPRAVSPHRMVSSSGSLSAPTATSSPPRLPRHQHHLNSHQHQQHQQHQYQHRLSLDSAPAPLPVQDPAKTRSLSFSSDHHQVSRPLHGSPLSLAVSGGSSTNKPANRGGHPPYSSPPPLLAMTGAMPLGVGRYSGSANSLPTFLSETSRLGDIETSTAADRGGNVSIKTSSSLPSPNTLTHHHHHQQQQQHYFHQRHSSGSTSITQRPQHQQQPHAHFPSQILHQQHQSYSIDSFKHEPMEEGEVRSRERSHSSVERRPSYLVDHSSDSNLVRRSSLGNYNHYRPSLSPQGHRPYLPHHPAYPEVLASPGRVPGSGHFLQHRGPGYERLSHSQSTWAPRSPISSHSSDENYDEPLQLTVRRDSVNHSTTGTTNSNNNNTNTTINSNQTHEHPPHDDSSRDSDSVPGHTASNSSDKLPAPLSGSPPNSSLPLKMRHKLPATHEFAYPKDFFPSMASAAVSVTQPSFQPHPQHHHHPFMNGLAHLSDMAFPQASPLSLIKTDNAAALPYRQPHRRESRSAAARRAGAVTDLKYLDPKYLERRRRNNEAARKCRENRKTLTKLREAKSDYLESENGKLREELGSLQEEMKQLRELIEKKRLEQGIPEDDLHHQLQQSHVES
ncbi:nuclear factor interleukin-3-regulated protein [Plakobranchus ocellatus]|uniref:Nuclear factor interleukin-3-regulated protein n=1 Tax=Plakobranchus ocellatus TaxID=259542 RepID=A0AAV3ZQ53_9GAST|nr:nuclear factor interleukin-3-regulated protein [Plakobranchus ocellatus]